MATLQTTPIPVPTSVTTGAGCPCNQFSQQTVHLYGTFVATVQVQISCGAANGTAPTSGDASWIDEGAPMTVPGTLQITKQANWVRAKTTAFTSGTPTAYGVGVYALRGD